MIINEKLFLKNVNFNLCFRRLFMITNVVKFTHTGETGRTEKIDV